MPRLHRRIRIFAESDLKDASEHTPQGAERLDRRNEVIHEALVEEVKRSERRKRRADNDAAVPEPRSAVAAARDLSEDPIAPDPEDEPATSAETEEQVNLPMEMNSDENVIPKSAIPTSGEGSP